ncbi:hypothetical protein [Streptomyces yangpuensis]|uniref:hypothetical protein n=1 Tax=Streptomyces yangpuensis TaxID=1648182 RepID=UPI00382D63B4
MTTHRRDFTSRFGEAGLQRSQVTPAPQGPADPHPPRTTGPGSALIGLRSALVLVLGILVGTGADVLTYLAQHNAATGVLAGGAAFAGSVLFFHNIIAG